MQFSIVKSSSDCQARVGQLVLPRGTISTPAFMPCATRGTVKAVTNSQLHEIGVEAFVTNAFHLFLRPEIEVIQQAGGWNSFSGWPGPIVSDSGGFQIFSLSELFRVKEEGVYFQSPIDGSHGFFGPKESMEVQKALRSDIALCFDASTKSSAPRKDLEKAVFLTVQWAKICRDFSLNANQSLFGIVQGGNDAALRIKCAKELVTMNFDGYALGGRFFIDEEQENVYKLFDNVIPALPEEKPRYVMGIGTPRNIVELVRRGVDLFDCVLPTRSGRHGTAFTWQGKIAIKRARYAKDMTPLDPELDFSFSKLPKAYLRYLFTVDEITGYTLLSLQNLAFYMDFMRKMREAILDERFTEFYKKVKMVYPM